MRCRLLLAVALVGAAACARGERPIEMTEVVRLPSDAALNTTLLSADGKAWAYVVATKEGERVVESGGVGPLHKKCLRLSFSPKTNRLFYWALDGPDDALSVTLFADGATIPTTFLAPGEVDFSADGTRWTAAGAAPGATRGELGEMSVMVDGTLAGRYDEISIPALSSDGQHFAFLARTADGVRIVVDGTEGRAFPPPAAPCAAAAVQSASRPDLATRHSVRFLADGGILVVTRDADGWGVYRDGLRIGSYAVSALDQVDDDCTHLSALAPGTVNTAADTPAAFWWERVAGDAEIWRVVRNGHPIDDVTCIEPWRRHPPEPSADATRVIYPCMTQRPDGGRIVHLIHGDTRYGPYENVWGIAPTKDGTHVAYGAALADGGERPWAIYVDGAPRATGFTSVWRPRISDDGTLVAWEGVRDPLERGIFGIDDRRIGSFDDVLWGPELEPDDRVAWVVRRGHRVTRIVVPIEVARRPRAATR